MPEETIIEEMVRKMREGKLRSQPGLSRPCRSKTYTVVSQDGGSAKHVKPGELK